MQSISNVHVSHLILYLSCKFYGNILNNCQNIATLLLGYFNLSHPVECGWELVNCISAIICTAVPVRIRFSTSYE